LDHPVWRGESEEASRGLRLRSARDGFEPGVAGAIRPWPQVATQRVL
jgi:hypothetical protein